MATFFKTTFDNLSLRVLPWHKLTKNNLYRGNFLTKSISQHNPLDFFVFLPIILYFLLYFSPFSFFFLIRKNIFVPKLNENQRMI